MSELRQWAYTPPPQGFWAGFWWFMDNKWPTERQWVTLLLAVLIGSLLKMADHDPTLWQVELFKTLLTASVITGALNMVMAFHFAANKSDEVKGRIEEQRASNTGILGQVALNAQRQGAVGDEQNPGGNQEQIDEAVEEAVEEVVDATVEAGESAKP